MKQIAIYGKGGIGKSTVSTHLSYAIANQGKCVLQVGCDPKSDSTHNLLTQFTQPILEVLSKHDFEYEDIEIDEILLKSPLLFDDNGTVFCAEAGGPEPGIGCGGKGVIEAIKTLKRLHVFEELNPDIVIYDILGDVVCGGFSMPIRDGYAEETYLVTSGELEALYQATNVMGAVRRFSRRSGAKLGGLIVNLRGLADEERIVNDFAEKMGTRVLSINPFSQLIKECGGDTKTVFEDFPDSTEAEQYRQLATIIMNSENELTKPETMTFEQLYEWWSGYIH
ncbi:MAG: AAA family ATPase [Gammaproteobacteria bacterium]|jgi:nitrogenase iron protein NifH|nr:nitrogenase iron protein [Chromatiales bacterium]MDP6674167.1 AAA family ATPase [Gammaproteobacteria bacterium]